MKKLTSKQQQQLQFLYSKIKVDYCNVDESIPFDELTKEEIAYVFNKFVEIMEIND